MARVKILLSESSLFKTKLRVRVTDLNYGAHLSNVSILAYAHEARVQWLQSINYSETDIESLGLIQSDAEIAYKAQAYLGDELEVEVLFGTWLSRGFDLQYAIRRLSDGAEIARVKTALIFFNYELQKMATIPEAFKTKLPVS